MDIKPFLLTVLVSHCQLAPHSAWSLEHEALPWSIPLEQAWAPHPQGEALGFAQVESVRESVVNTDPLICICQRVKLNQ